MKFDYKGNPEKNSNINDFVEYIENADNNQTWEYCGLQVKLDITFDFNDENALVRWHEKKEGFNDKIILNSLNDFLSNFKPL